MQFRGSHIKLIAVKIILALGLVVSHSSSVVAQNFYDSSVETRDLIVDLQSDYGANGLGNQDDTDRFQSAIDFVSGQGGGVVTVPGGSYKFLNVNLKSNVHLEIDSSANLAPFLPVPDRNVALFTFGRNIQIENVSVRGIGGNFRIDVPLAAPDTTVFSMNDVTNFYVGNVDIQDSLSKFSSFALGAGLRNPTDTGIPTMGTIENARTFDAHYGYGLVQVQAANSVNFHNLYAQGGVTLRLESGWTRMNDWQPEGVGIFNIVGDTLVSEDGNATVMLSPHAMFNGEVNIDNILSLGSGFAARVDVGFVSNNYTNPDLVPGEFEPSSLTNIHAVYGENAQLKPKHFQFVPPELVHLIQDMSTSEDGSSVRGPAIAPVVYRPNYDVSLAGVTGDGFEFNPIIVPEGAYQLPLLGDVNLDSAVNFLDIGPFIALLTSGVYQDEADCDGNGVVSFLDISPFIAILSGN